MSNLSHGYSANFPVFSTYEAAEAYLLGQSDAVDALNYAKTYRIADWLADDWAGVLLDPLTGLHALGDWANIARHQGLSALGNELDLVSFLNYLRDFFANLGTRSYILPVMQITLWIRIRILIRPEILLFPRILR